MYLFNNISFHTTKDTYLIIIKIFNFGKKFCNGIEEFFLFIAQKVSTFLWLRK